MINPIGVSDTAASISAMPSTVFAVGKIKMLLELKKLLEDEVFLHSSISGSGWIKTHIHLKVYFSRKSKC